jgi:phage shock protein A
MGQQSIFGRIAQLTKANINSLLDSAEDPETMLDQMIRDYTSNIGEAEEAIAQTIGNLRMIEEDAKEATDAAVEWGGKAAAAARKGQELRAAGSTAEADKFDNLARVALKKQIDLENDVKELQPNIAQQTEVVNKLKAGLEGMKSKLDDLQHKRDELVSRAKMAEAQTQVHDALKSVDIMDPTSEVSRFEEKIRREEAKAAGQAELAASSLDAQFESLEDVADDAEVEARLAALTAGAAPQPALAPAEAEEEPAPAAPPA